MRKTAPALFLLLAIGCGSKVEFETTVTLTPDGDRTWVIDAPKKDQRVRVEVDCSGTPADLVVLLAKDSLKTEQEMQKSPNSPPSSAVGSKMNTPTATLEVTIPAGEQFVVLLRSRGKKDTTAHVKVKSV